MNKQIVHSITSSSPAATEKLGVSIGGQLLGGEAIELIGDVGAGKTTFVRGLAKGIGSSDRVSSPTFTINKVYASNKVTLHHYDFYRLDDLEIIKNELAEVLSEPGHAAVLEWADEVRGVLPDEHIKIFFTATGEVSRSLQIDIPQDNQYIKVDP
jgi:tRNA threonylcarbamoyladenosine biosynthesis protein TsaE